MRPIQERGKPIHLDTERYPCKWNEQVIDEHIESDPIHIKQNKTKPNMFINALNNVCKCNVVHQTVYLERGVKFHRQQGNKKGAFSFYSFFKI